MTYLRAALFCGAAGVVSTLCPHAMAGDVQDDLQIAFGASVFSMSDTTTETTVADQTTDADRDSVDWGIGPSRTTLEVGYGFSSEMVLGGFAQLGAHSDNSEADNVSTERSTLLLGPKFDYHFSSEEITPFVGVVVGLARVSSTTELDLNNSETKDAYSALGYTLGARLGARWFVASAVSIDPQLNISYTSVSGDGETRVQVGALSVVTEDERKIAAMTLSIGVAASLWL